MSYRAWSLGRGGLLRAVAVVGAGLVAAPAALGQYGGPVPRWPMMARAEKPPHLAHQVAPRDAASASDEDAPLSKREALRELKKIRAKYFGTMRNVEIRQIGITKMRVFTDPWLYPKMLEIFQREQPDVRGALLDHFADQQSDEGDVTLAWAAVFDHDAWFRTQAAERLVRRMRAIGAVGTESDDGSRVPGRIKKVVENGLQQADDEPAIAAAGLAGTLKLFEMIPALINAQVQGGGGGGGIVGDRTGALAVISIGNQQAFISDLTPVVGDSAVAFDPTVSVLTEGVVMAIQDAVVVTYRTEIHRQLVGLGNAGWNKPTDGLGWDTKAWRDWYAREFVPYRQQLAAGKPK
jgi:hypothetical protein